ncbi:MAG: hypothetical protein ABIE43_04665 [Patescibacteria group bacterium]
MKITKKQLLLFIVLITLSVAQFFLIKTAPEAYAESKLWGMQEGKDTIGSTAFGNSGAPLDVRVIIARAIKAFLGFMGVIFLILLVLAGYKYMNSRGNEEKVTEAIGQIRTAIIGLLIVVASYALTSYITSCVVEITNVETIWGCK